MAWTALVVALLVPARAVALCCVDASSQRSPSAEPHDGFHHAPSGPVTGDSAFSSETGVPDCESLEESAPALRERGPTDGGSVAAVLDAAIAIAYESAPTAFRHIEQRPVDALRVPLVPLRI